METTNNSVRWRGYLWLAVCAAVGVALTYLFIDSYQQDGGTHFIFSRWGWRHPDMFVGVWTRPLFTFIYGFPALISYHAAKLFTVLICVLTAWQTWRVARLYQLERNELVILFVLFQPAFFLMWADTMTEPIFALVFITALYLHLTGWVRLGAFVASLMLLARPEGFFLGAMWGFWMLFDSRVGSNLIRRVPWTLLLASGAVIWVVAAWAISGDILFIKHNWPSDWNATGATYGRGPVWDYLLRSPEMVGPLLLVPFFVGLVTSITGAGRRVWHCTVSVLTLFVIHSILRVFGIFGSAGYARYFVCVSPAIAIITLVGWNRIAGWIPMKPLRVGLAVAVLVVSGVLCFLYTDSAAWNRDARAVDEMTAWWKQNELPVTRLVRSQAYQGIAIDRDPWEQPTFSYDDREKNLQTLRELPHRTLVFWDGQTGPAWYKLTADDIEATGFRRLRSQNYVLNGYVMNKFWFGYGGPRNQEMHLLYKD